MTIEKLEKIRKVLILSIILTIITIVCSVLLLFIYMFSNADNTYMNTFWILIIISIILICLCYISKVFFIKLYKKTYINSILSTDFKNINYKSKDNFDKEMLELVGLSKNMKIYKKRKVKQTDFISGIYNNIKFIQGDLTVTEIRDNDILGHRFTEHIKVFSGIITEFDISLSNEPILLYTSEFNILNTPFKKIKLDSNQFNKKFEVRAQEEQEAFLLLTPKMMEILNDILENVLSNEFFLLCYKNKTYLGQNNIINTFEPKLTEKINEENIKQNILDSVWYLIPFIKKLELERIKR